MFVDGRKSIHILTKSGGTMIMRKKYKSEEHFPKGDRQIKQNDNISKNTKKLIAPMIILSVILIGVCVCVINYFSQKKINAVSEASTTVINFLDAYHLKSGDANNYLNYPSLFEDPINYEGYQGYCAEKISYKIIDAIENDRNFFTVSVEIQNIDLNAVLNELDEKNFNEDDDIVENFYSLLQSNDVPTRIYECDIVCKQYPTGMKIIFNAELSDALLGGYSSCVTGHNE